MSYKDYTMTALEELLDDLTSREEEILVYLAAVRLKKEGLYNEINNRIDALQALKAGKTKVKVATRKCTCDFDQAWVGKCKETDLLENGQCEKHQQNCRCGKLATRDCAATIGPLICGAPLCGSCRCH